MRQLAVVVLAVHAALCDTIVMKPMYKYRYETEDVMKAAESSVPVHGYHVIEGGYYPMEDVGSYGGEGGYIGGGSGGYIGGGGGDYIGGGGGYISGGDIGYGDHFIPPPIPHGGVTHIGYGGGLGNVGYGGGPLLHTNIGYGGGIRHLGGGIGGGGYGLGGLHGYGGEEIEKEVYSQGKKNIDDGRYEKAFGKKGGQSNQGEQGFSRGEVALKDVKGDSGYYNNHEGGKKVYEDGKQYHGGQHFDKEGKNAAEKTVKQGHRKGHKVKGFKSSHHKDETGHSEEYYDEAHDEGGNYGFQGHSGRFGENGASAYKGGNQDSKYNAGEAKKEGFYENKHITDKADGNQGQYGQNKYAGNNAVYNVKNGADEQSLLGHQESSKFYKHHPFVVPFHY